MAPKAPMDNYQAESDARTLVEAHKIKSDKKRHGAAMKHCADHVANYKKVMGRK